jgi:hypothetical protein
MGNSIAALIIKTLVQLNDHNLDLIMKESLKIRKIEALLLEIEWEASYRQKTNKV